MKWRVCSALCLAGCCLLYGQQDPLAPLAEGQRDLANGNYVAARQQTDLALERVRNIVPDPSVARQVLLASAEVDALMADFDGARRMAAVLQENGGLAPEQEVRRQVVLAQCAVGQGDLRAASNAATAAVDSADRANLTGDTRANAWAELAEVRRLEGNFAEARRLSAAVVTATKGRLSSPELSAAALVAPPEIAFSTGQAADARNLAEAALAARRADHPAALALRDLLARVAIAEGRLPVAARYLAGLTDTAKSRLGPAHPFAAECLLTEAAYSLRRGSWEDARAKLENVSTLSGSRLANGTLRLRVLLYNANAALGLNRVDDAANYLAQAAPLAGSGPVERAALLNGQAAVAIERQRYEDAEKYLDDADAMLSQLTEERQPVRMDSRFYRGLLYARWGDPERAEAPLAKWIDLRPADAGDQPEATALSLLGHNAFRRKQYDRAANMLLLSINIRGSLGGDSGIELAADYQDVGASLRQTGKPDDAVTAFRSALEIKGRRAQPGIAEVELYRSLAETLESLGRVAEALPYFETWLRLANQAGPGSEDALLLTDRVSQLQIREGHFDAAEPLLRRLYDAGQQGRGPGARDKTGILERLGQTETRLNHYSRAADFFSELARIDLLNKKLPDAEKFALRARDSAQQSQGTPDLASALNVLADVRLAQNKPADAKALYLQAAADAGANSRTKAVSLDGQGRIALANHEWASADQLLGQALDAVREDRNPSPGLEALIYANRAHSQDLTGHPAEAITLYAHFLELEPQSKPPQDPPLRDQLNEAAGFYSRQAGHAQDVLEVYNRVASSSENVFGRQSDEYAYALYDLALAYARNNRNDEAIDKYAESSRLYEQSHSIQSDEVRNVRSQMADAYLAEGKIQEAIQLIEPVLPDSPDMSNETQTALLLQLAGLYRKVNDQGKAAGIYQRVRDASARQPRALSQNATWLSATENLIAADIEKGDPKGAEALRKTEQAKIRKSAGNKDSGSEVHMLRAYSEALKKSGRDMKLAAQIDETANQMDKRLSVK